MKYKELTVEIVKKRSFLCIGLDSDITRIPVHLKKYKDPVFEFNRQIIESTHDLVIAYKPNIAFYESRGAQGWLSLEKTVKFLKKNYPQIFLIADAKRGDIGNTSKEYAKAFFEHMNFDAITLSPYMGEDSISPFLDFKDKWVINLALTSNKGASDFQFITDNESNSFLFEKVIEKSMKWGSKLNTMFVIGATKADYMKQIRKLAPDYFLLIPGIGEQGGSLKDIAKNGLNKNCGLIVNSSRGIIFADDTNYFAQRAREKAFAIKAEMEKLLKIYL